LDLQTFDLEDVKQIRTHKAISIRIEDPELSDDPIIAEGLLIMIGDKIIMTEGDETREFKRNQLVSIAQTDKKEIDLWSFSISLGANIRGGNTETTDLNLQANAKRRTASSKRRASKLQITIDSKVTVTLLYRKIFFGVSL
jgi:hypothetical protein